jgi:VanZ family protein
MQKLKNFRYSISWAIVILILSGINGKYIRKIHFQWFPIPKFTDKVVHFSMYFIFTALLILSLIEIYPNKKFKILFISSIIAFCYGVLMEVLQKFLFIGRSAEVLDVVANTTGIIACLVIIEIYKQRKSRFLEKL